MRNSGKGGNYGEPQSADDRTETMPVFLEVNKPLPVVLFEVAKGMITGSTPEIGETHRIG
jgi:hypothetical protein